MTPLKEFQLEHGRDWEALTQTPVFSAALAMAQSEKIKVIANLTDDEIATRGHVILADLRGFLRYESGLLGLHEEKEFVFQEVGPETYPDPITEAAEEAAAEEQEKAQRSETVLILPRQRSKKKSKPTKKQKAP